jgi:prepilin-type N-terminal cleavage/methylation domain-containing protein
MRISSLIRKNHGLTIVEIMMALAILSLGISALLQTFSSGVKFSSDTENNIKAINIAREGIESMINIRDTNWLRFTSDRTNCWIVAGYDGLCIGNITLSFNDGSYTAFSTNGVWMLSGITTPPVYTSWTNYKNTFRVGIDANGYFTQTGVSTTPCSSSRQSDCLTIFTREIILDVTLPDTLKVTSIARWNMERPRNVSLETTLTNWKSKF